MPKQPDAPPAPGRTSSKSDVPAAPRRQSDPNVPQAAPRRQSDPNVPQAAPRRQSDPNVPQAAPRRQSSPNVPQAAPPRQSSPNVPQAAPRKQSDPHVPQAAPRRQSDPNVPQAAPRKQSDPHVPQAAPRRQSDPSAPQAAPRSQSDPSVPAPELAATWPAAVAEEPPARRHSQPSVPAPELAATWPAAVAEEPPARRQSDPVVPVPEPVGPRPATVAEEPPARRPSREIHLADEPEEGHVLVRKGTIVRFRRGERFLHWSIALPFLTCLVSAAVLVIVYNPNPLLPHRQIFSWIHRIAAVALLTLPPLAIITHPRALRTHLSNIRVGFTWRLEDLKWLAMAPLAALSSKVKLPEEPKFNAGEKLNFMSTFIMWPLMGVSGILIWTQTGVLAPWVVHFAAAVAVIPLIGGHIFMATINPASRKGLSGMFTGRVDRQWASHHYRRWFKETFGDPHADDAGEPYDAMNDPSDIYTIVQGQPIPLSLRQRLAQTALSVVALGSLIVGLIIVGRGYLTTIEAYSYVLVDQPLLSQPQDDAPPVPGGDIPRGTHLTTFSNFGSYMLVQDERGRAGYLHIDFLGSKKEAAPVVQVTESCEPNCEATPGHESPEDMAWTDAPAEPADGQSANSSTQWKAKEPPTSRLAKANAKAKAAAARKRK